MCAGSFRSSALVKALQAIAPTAEIDIITTLPNRYSSFSQEAPEYENDGNISIHRIKLPSHKSGMLDQSKAFLTYARKTLNVIKGNQYDLVYATSSRLMTAALGSWIAKKNKSPLYLDIRDIFVDTIKDVLPTHLSILRYVFDTVEKLTIKQANKVNLVSKGFEDYFSSRYPNTKFSYYFNGVDDEFIDASSNENNTPPANNPISVLYAGNLGEGQGLHSILPSLANKLAGKVQFVIFGDGGRREALESALEKEQISNVEIHPPVTRDQLIEEYKQADILFLHLNDYDAFKKVLPSKVFEYAALGKPIWAGVAGFAAKFINSEIENAQVFEPCNSNQGLETFQQLKVEHTPRKDFIDKYKRSSIMKDMAKDILSITDC